MEEKITKLKEFESTIKTNILNEYGSFIMNEKINNFNNKDYTSGIVLNDNIDDNYEVVRNMFNDLINITCKKEFNINNQTLIVNNYGELLQKLLVEYYIKQISNKYNLNINVSNFLNDNISIIDLLKINLGETLDMRVFNENANELLTTNNLESLSSILDQQVLSYYNNENKKSELLTQEEINEYMERFASGEELSINELEELKYSISYYDKQDNQNKRQLGFTSTKMALYFVILAIFLSILIGALLF